MTYRLTRLALSDIEDITRYTLEYFGEGQAQEYIDGLFYSFDLLMDNPKIGRAFEDRMRRYVYKSHLVYYEIKPEEIHILRILHGRMKPEGKMA